MTAKAGVEVEIRQGGIVVVKAKNDTARAFLKRLKEEDERKAEIALQSFDETTDIKDELNEDDVDGPNHRGTYSKSYTLQHPEIEWIHRGQGRYLPASQHSRKSNSNRSDR